MKIKNMLIVLKCAALAAMSMGLALGARAAEPVEYLEPVYNTPGVPASGIDHWVTKSVSDYSVVASSESVVTWGEQGKTNWFVATEADVEIASGIVCKGFVNLILCKGAKLTVEGAQNRAAIQTDDHGAFVIYGTPEGEGELSATGGNKGAGIGGSDDYDTGVGSHITINGGKVTAQSTGFTAAGIGAGMQAMLGYDITINGGTVIAQSLRGGAGIGGAALGTGHDITLNGGRVLACSGHSAAIGGGRGMTQDDYCSEDAAGYNITINGGSVCVSGQGDVIGSRVTNHPAYNNRIAAGANVLFCLDASLEEPLELTESMVLVGSAESLEGLNYTLAGGLVDFGIETLTMTNATTHETQTVTVDDEAPVRFSGKKAAVRVSDGFAKLFVGQPIEATPTTMDHATITGVYTNGVLSSASSPWTVWTYEPAFVVYEAESGYVFQDGSTVMTNMLDTTVSPAASTRPLPSPLQGTPVAELRDAEGVWQGVFDSLTNAINAATDGQTVALLTNIQESVTFTNAVTVTLDLAGWTLMPASGKRVITVNYAATVKIRDTSAAKTGSITTGGESYNGDGAGVYVDNGALYMFGVTITNCVANGNGGAICGNYNARILLKDCTVKGNSATGNGGGICMLGGETTSTEVSSVTGKLVLIATVITDNAANGNGGGVYFKKTVNKSCFVAGTMIRLADGSEKAIENIREGDVVATFDHEGGTNSSARVYYAFKSEDMATPFTLEFDAAVSAKPPYQLSIVGCHDLLEQGSRKYVTITGANVGQYIGAKFYGADGAWHTLTKVTMGTEAVDYYSIYSAQHQNVYANGLLTVADDVDYLLNVYELDENLKADAAQLAADLAQYGIMSYEEAATYGVSPEWYDAGSTKYLNVAIGKQLVSKEYAKQLFASTGRAASPLAAVASVGGRAATALQLAAEPKLEDYTAVGFLTLGGSTVVTNNIANGIVNNVYLDKIGDDGNSLIDLVGADGDRAGMNVGVTLQWENGQFTTATAYKGDVGYFWDDTGTYAVWYDSGKYLKLADGSQIVPPALAHTSYEIWKGDEVLATNEATTVAKNTSVTVVYTADDGYVFDGSGAKTMEVSVDTSKTVATMTSPDEPFEPAASVTANGVTTVYATLTGAWADATTLVENADVLVTLLKDATVDATLVRSSSGKSLTLDLNDKVLAYAGVNDAYVIHQSGGTAMHIIDTATKRTPRYFTCDAETGLWTLTNEVSDLTVSGGLITGGRASALDINYGGASISNVNFVGNSSAGSGGAVLVSMGSLTVAESAFFGNVSGENGGAISAVGACEMSDCRVESNVAAGLGGGVYMRLSGSLVRTSVVGNKAETGGGVYLTCVPSCFPAGVKIMMADGNEKNVEDIVKGDVVATFDHVGGTNSSAAVFYVYSGMGSRDTFKLTFASGATLDIADRHDLLLETTRKYVTVSADNARTFIGKRFYNYTKGCWDELTGVTAAKGCDAHYSIYVRGHANCVANGMLTVPDDKDCFINVYELDENLKADAAQLAADIATYGLAEPADYPNVPLDDFEYGNNRYARIAIGKGLTTQAEILYWNEFDYGPVVEKKDVLSAPKLTMSAAPKMLTGGSNTEADAPAAPYLQVGEGTVVTGNVTTAGQASNVYLNTVNDKTPVIDILSGTTDLDVGVTLSTDSGVFGWTNDVNYASSFTSDSYKYRVVYTAEKTLELVAFNPVARSEKTNGGSSVIEYHSSLAAAVDAIGPDGVGTVTMLADVTMAETGAAWVPNGSDLTLDLAGKKIEWTTTKGDSLLYFAADTNGKLTITDSDVGGTISTYCDSSEVTNSALIAFCVGNGDLTVNGGTFVCSNKFGAATLFFKNGTGNWAFNGGTYKALGEGSGGAHFLYCKAAAGTTRITGGTYDIRATASAGAGIASNAECHDKITVTGGDFDVVTTGAWGGAFSCGNGSLIVDGGDFCVTSSAAGVSCILAEREGTTILSNGTFRTETTDGYAYAACANMTASLTIAGGTYYSKAFKDTAATVVGKEQSTVTIVGNPVINNGATEGSAWNLAVQLWGAHLYFTGYTGAPLQSLAVFADSTYGASFVKGEKAKCNSASLWAGYYSERPDDWSVMDSNMVTANLEEDTKAEYPWVIVPRTTFTPATIAHTTATVLTNGVPMEMTGDCYWLPLNTTGAEVVYNADPGYFFDKRGTKAVTNAIDATKNPATAESPEEPLPAIQVGNDAWALIDAGVCTVLGAGDMWSYEKAGVSPLWESRSAITNLVVESGITGVGSRFFENMWWLMDVRLGADCTNVAARAFKKCYGLTNVTSVATGESWVGDYAFSGCHSLQALNFGDDGKPEFGEGAYTFKTAIYMRDGEPDIYTIPELTMGNYDAVKQGSNDLKEWVEIDDKTKKNFHFFRITLKQKK